MATWKNRIVGEGEANPAALKANPRNWRKHPEAQRQALRTVLGIVGWVAPILVNRTTGNVVDGHARIDEAIDAGELSVPVAYLDLSEDEEARVLATLDPIGAMATTDHDALRDLINMIHEPEADLAALLKDIAPSPYMRNNPGCLADTFGAPPFSVLDTRQGYWQERKKIWRQLIQDEGETRKHALAGQSPILDSINDGVSILDPVLAEIMVAWFAPRGGTVFDPFAGDTVFGYVSAARGMSFRGIELREDQAQLNQDRVNKAGLDAVYFNGDSREMDKWIPDESVDMVFTCPPYADLEVYSEDPRDLSTLDHTEFLEAYRHILEKTYAKLKNNRFAVVVISEVRAKTGAYMGLVPFTIDTMRSAGYCYHNEIIIVGVAGTLPLRAPLVMRATRRVGRMHQNALVFTKGEPGNAAKEIERLAIARYKKMRVAEPDHHHALVFLKGSAKAASDELGPAAIFTPENPDQ